MLEKMELNEFERRRLRPRNAVSHRLRNSILENGSLLIEHTLAITGKPVEEFKRDCDNHSIVDATLDEDPNYQLPESAVEALLPNLVKCIGWRGDIPELVREEQFESLQELKNALTTELD